MSEINIQQMLDGLCRSAEAHDGEAFASYFAEDGVYHDGFYGAFHGRERVAEMINHWFYKDARDLRWDMIEPVVQGNRLYVRYIFSYNSTLPEAEDARTMFEGVSMMLLRDGKIVEYREIADVGTAFADMKFHPSRIFTILSRRAFAMKQNPEVWRHLPSSQRVVS